MPRPAAARRFLAALVAIPCLALAQAPEGEVMLYTSLVPQDLTALAAAFERKYGVKLKSWRANSEKVLQRALTEARAGRFDVDVVETNWPQLESLYLENALQPLRSPHLMHTCRVAAREIPLDLKTYSHGAEKMKQKGAPVEWFAIAPAIGRANGIGIVRKPPHPHAAALFVDFLLSPEGQAILQKGGYVPANLRVADRAQKLPLKFVDPAVILDEDAKWKKLWAEIILGSVR